MTRIIGGAWGGRRIGVPPQGTRPTSDRVREAMFSSVTSTLARTGKTWDECTVVDLYAGSGALGLEAASRGARDVVLVESARAAALVARANIDSLGSSGVQISSMAAIEWAQSWRGAPRDLIFADPPYSVEDAELIELWQAMENHGLASDDALVIVERSTASANPLGVEWTVMDQRRYGDTVVWYGRRTK